MTGHASHRFPGSLLLPALAVALWAVAPCGATLQQPGPDVQHANGR